MKIERIIFVLTVFLVSLGACKFNAKNLKKDHALGTSDNLETKAIPFKIAENYFINNTVNEKIPVKIGEEKIFNKFFGKATHIGNTGKPTPIDFSNEYVIVVELEETNKSSELTPVRFYKNKDNLVLNYKVDEGQDLGFIVRPFMIIVIKKQHVGNIILNRD